MASSAAKATTSKSKASKGKGKQRMADQGDDTAMVPEDALNLGEVSLLRPLCLRCSKDPNRLFECDKPFFQKCSWCATGRHLCHAIPSIFYTVVNFILQYAERVAAEEIGVSIEQLRIYVARYDRTVSDYLRVNAKEGKTRVPSSLVDVEMLKLQELRLLSATFGDIMTSVRILSGRPQTPALSKQLVALNVLEPGAGKLPFFRNDPAERLPAAFVEEPLSEEQPVEEDEDEDMEDEPRAPRVPLEDLDTFGLEEPGEESPLVITEVREKSTRVSHARTGRGLDGKLIKHEPNPDLDVEWSQAARGRGVDLADIFVADFPGGTARRRIVTWAEAESLFAQGLIYGAVPSKSAKTKRALFDQAATTKRPADLPANVPKDTLTTKARERMNQLKAEMAARAREMARLADDGLEEAVEEDWQEEEYNLPLLDEAKKLVATIRNRSTANTAMPPPSTPGKGKGKGKAVATPKSAASAAFGPSPNKRQRQDSSASQVESPSARQNLGESPKSTRGPARGRGRGRGGRGKK